MSSPAPPACPGPTAYGHDWYSMLKGKQRMAPLSPRVQAALRGLSFAHRRAIFYSTRGTYPPNWIRLLNLTGDEPTPLDIPALSDVASRGIPVVWVPRPELLKKFITSRTADLVSLMLAEEEEILEDSEVAVNKLSSGPLRDLIDPFKEAVEAARANYHSCAQALAANIFDTALRREFPLGVWQGYRTLREAIVSFRRSSDISHLRPALAWGPALLATDRFGTETGIPTSFNRHATAHAVSREQYTRPNALVALMVTASALRECYEAPRIASRNRMAQ
jgi:hypothetical protein